VLQTIGRVEDYIYNILNGDELGACLDSEELYMVYISYGDKVDILQPKVDIQLVAIFLIHLSCVLI
jgi:hypothetical protein